MGKNQQQSTNNGTTIDAAVKLHRSRRDVWTGVIGEVFGIFDTLLSEGHGIEGQNVTTGAPLVTERQNVTTAIPQVTEVQNVTTEAPQVTERQNITTAMPPVTKVQKVTTGHRSAKSYNSNASGNRSKVCCGNV
ncbi:MAG: hypothetical protein PG981_001189 [Wolbachia endosymbiont of Ctenocephalides orientis wCori]|nr:MAG: hypothetical protein PG981_001189 [Wolbachia endosymbiont of Ctenocephalides orientis wCori]